MRSGRPWTVQKDSTKYLWWTCECKIQDSTEKFFVLLFLPSYGELLFLLPYGEGSVTQRKLLSVSYRNGPSTKLGFHKSTRSTQCPFLDSEPAPKCPLDFALTVLLKFWVMRQRDGLSSDHDTQCGSAGGIPFAAEVKPNSHKSLLLMPQADKIDVSEANEVTLFVNKKLFCSFFFW